MTQEDELGSYYNIPGKQYDGGLMTAGWHCNFLYILKIFNETLDRLN